MGRACADALAPTVDVLVLVDRDASSLEVAATELRATGVDVRTFAADVTDRGRLEELVAEVAAAGTFRSLAHAAGISPTMADWRPIFEVDLVGSALILDVLRPLVAPGTAAVLFASRAAQIVASSVTTEVDTVLDEPLDPAFLDRIGAALGPSVGDLAYPVAKRGVQRLARREALRWGASGGRVCSISPGMIDTPMGNQEADAQEAMTAMLALSPVPRLGRPDELAAVVAFLLSDQASFLTGTDLLVDGGVCAALGVG
jgi:NAD(P)-dependent dehydrogenase (short-subunit alcohol dehydrogenase family)